MTKKQTKLSLIDDYICIVKSELICDVFNEKTDIDFLTLKSSKIITNQLKTTYLQVFEHCRMLDTSFEILQNELSTNYALARAKLSNSLSASTLEDNLLCLQNIMLNLPKKLEKLSIHL